MSERLIRECQGRWREVLLALGMSDTFLTGRHGPCPICGGKDRFRFDDKDGSGSYFCGQCPKRSGYGLHLVQAAFGWDYVRACHEVEAIVSGSRHDSETVTRPAVVTSRDVTRDATSNALQRAKQLWRERVELTADNAGGRYLHSRGLAIPSEQRGIAFHPRTLYLDDAGEFVGRFPALLGIVQGVGNEPVGVHRTFLTPAGEKAGVPSPRRLLGSMPEGAAIRLAQRGAVLGIAEGIETALSASKLFGVPCWSAINSSGLASWKPPEEVNEVIIFGDNDPKYGGQAAAFHLAHRLACRGLTVRVEIPDTVGKDWNDVLLRGAAR